MTPAALVALYCVAAAPAPLVGTHVHRALRGEPVAAAAIRPVLAEAIKGAAARPHGRRH